MFLTADSKGTSQISNVSVSLCGPAMNLQFVHLPSPHDRWEKPQSPRVQEKVFCVIEWKFCMIFSDRKAGSMERTKLI